MLPYFLSSFVGYLVGSIPTAYLLVRFRSNVDITRSGSGNVGALNAGVVTGSKGIGIAVGVLDGVKGLTAVLAAGWVGHGFWIQTAALLGAIMGHNYSVWLKFRGGRGLATACGGLFAIGVAYTIVWCTIWAVLKWQKQTVLAANLLATVATPFVLLLVPAGAIEIVMIAHADAWSYRVLSFAMSTLLLLSHQDAFAELKRKPPSSS